MLYICEFVIGYLILLYSFWKTPGLFKFDIIFDSIISLVIMLIIFGISYALNKLISHISKKGPNKIFFSIICIILFIIFMLWSGRI